MNQNFLQLNVITDRIYCFWSQKSKVRGQCAISLNIAKTYRQDINLDVESDLNFNININNITISAYYHHNK